MKSTIIKTIVALATILSFQSSYAQYGWVKTTIKGCKSAYSCSKNPNDKEAIFVNKNYDREDILKVYPGFSLVDPSFLGYKTDLHDLFLKVIKESINCEKVKVLANRNEPFYVGFDLNQDGKLLGVIFMLDTATIITTDELYCLEENIKTHFAFKPIRKVNVKLMGGFGITTNFKEIITGEIPSIRRTEEKQRETERLFGN